MASAAGADSRPPTADRQLVAVRSPVNPAQWRCKHRASISELLAGDCTMHSVCRPPLRRHRSPAGGGRAEIGCLTPPIPVMRPCAIGIGVVSLQQAPQGARMVGTCRFSRTRRESGRRIDTRLGSPFCLLLYRTRPADLITRADSPPRSAGHGALALWSHSRAPSPTHRFRDQEVGAPPASSTSGGTERIRRSRNRGRRPCQAMPPRRGGPGPGWCFSDR